MSNFGCQRKRTTGGTIANNEAINFNVEIANYDSTITYTDPSFILSSNADYFVSWFVTIKTGLGIKGLDVQLVADTEPETVYSSSNSMKTGQISGTAVIRATSGLKLQLVNKTGQSIVLADNVDVTANISIIQINTDTAGIELYLTDSQGGDLLGGNIVPFNTTFSKYNDLITNKDGTINILVPGRYIIDWSVAIDGSLDAASIKFNLINTLDDVENILGISESPLVLHSSIYGTAIINVPNASIDKPYSLQLVNKTANAEGTLTQLTLAQIGIQATMRIVQV